MLVNMNQVLLPAKRVMGTANGVDVNRIVEMVIAEIKKTKNI